MKARVESMMEEDVQPSFGLAIDEGQHRDHTLGFQHSSLQRRIDGTYNVISPPLGIVLSEAELSRPVWKKSGINPDFLIFLAGRLNLDFLIFLAGRLILPTFCRLFRKTPDFKDFFNFWTLADLIPTSNFSTLV